LLPRFWVAVLRWLTLKAATFWDFNRNFSISWNLQGFAISTLKTQLHAVNACVKRSSHRSLIVNFSKNNKKICLQNLLKFSHLQHSNLQLFNVKLFLSCSVSNLGNRLWRETELNWQWKIERKSDTNYIKGNSNNKWHFLGIFLFCAARIGIFIMLHLIILLISSIIYLILNKNHNWKNLKCFKTYINSFPIINSIKCGPLRLFGHFCGPFGIFCCFCGPRSSLSFTCLF